MKMCKSITALLLAVLTAFVLLPVQALAVGYIDTDRDVSLSVSCMDGRTPLEGVKVDIYLVAEVDECGELTVTEAFDGFNVNIRGENDDAWRAVAATLEGYVLRDRIPAVASAKTNNKGQVSFPESGDRLTQGLYLVLSHRHIQGGIRYDFSPFMVVLPVQDKAENVWVYKVTANAKYDSEIMLPSDDDGVDIGVLKVWKDEGHENSRPKEIVVQLLRDGVVYDTETLSAGNNWRYTWFGLDAVYKWTVVEKEMKKYTVETVREGDVFVVTNTYGGSSPGGSADPTLPQTGQLWWPVPVMIAAGMFFVAVGLIRRRGNGNEK